MLNAAIDDSDSLYRQGIEKVLEDILEGKQNEKTQFSKLTRENVTKADIIIKSFVAGAEYICHPILKYRNKPGMIIGLYDGERNPHHKELPLCIKDVIFINRAEPLDSTRKRLEQAWEEGSQTPKDLHGKKCLLCKYRTLTPQQLAIAKYLLQGKDVSAIALQLAIGVKTVSAHKRLMMSKFNLNTDYELLLFLNNLKKHNPPVHLQGYQE